MLLFCYGKKYYCGWLNTIVAGSLHVYRLDNFKMLKNNSNVHSTQRWKYYVIKNTISFVEILNIKSKENSCSLVLCILYAVCGKSVALTKWKLWSQHFCSIFIH